MIKAILYDLDGVLVDACEWHYESLNRALFDTYGFKISREDHEKTYNGLPTRSKLSIMVEKDLIDKKDIDRIWNLKQKHTEKAISDLAKDDEDKITIHKITRLMGMKSACVTNSIEKTAKLMLRNTGQIDYLDVIISNEDVSSPKPDPEGYIKAMRLLGVNPSEVIIIEDSDVGNASARASGGNVVRVRDPYDVTLEKICKSIILHSE